MAEIVIQTEAGPSSGLEPASLAREIRNLMSRPEERRSMKRAGRALVDGRGMARVGALLGALACHAGRKGHPNVDTEQVACMS